MRLFILMALFVLLSTSPSKADDHYDLIIRADGIVCDFCAQSLNKVFLKNENIEKIDVDMDKSTVNVVLKDGGDVSDDEFKRMIEWGGYDFVSITRK